MRTCIHARKLALRIVWRMASATLLDSDDIVSRVVFVLAAYESKGLTVSHVMRRRHALKNKKLFRQSQRTGCPSIHGRTDSGPPPLRSSIVAMKASWCCVVYRTWVLFYLVDPTDVIGGLSRGTYHPSPPALRHTMLADGVGGPVSYRYSGHFVNEHLVNLYARPVHCIGHYGIVQVIVAQLGR